MRNKKEVNSTGLLAALALALVLTPAIASAQQTVFVVRHAERADDGMAANNASGAPVDPPLSAAGEARAARLATMLADSGIRAIYVTEFKRTQDTAKPLAAKLGITAEIMPAKDTAGLIAKVRKEHPNDAVLVIGHSNTVPEIVEALTGKVVTLGDQEYNAMFVLTPSAGTVALIRW